MTVLSLNLTVTIALQGGPTVTPTLLINAGFLMANTPLWTTQQKWQSQDSNQVHLSLATPLCNPILLAHGTWYRCHLLHPTPFPGRKKSQAILQDTLSYTEK